MFDNQKNNKEAYLVVTAQEPQLPVVKVQRGAQPVHFISNNLPPDFSLSQYRLSVSCSALFPQRPPQPAPEFYIEEDGDPEAFDTFYQDAGTSQRGRTLNFHQNCCRLGAPVPCTRRYPRKRDPFDRSFCDKQEVVAVNLFGHQCTASPLKTAKRSPIPNYRTSGGGCGGGGGVKCDSSDYDYYRKMYDRPKRNGQQGCGGGGGVRVKFERTNRMPPESIYIGNRQRPTVNRFCQDYFENPFPSYPMARSFSQCEMCAEMQDGRGFNFCDYYDDNCAQRLM